jgi:hypothetical protein
MTPESFSISKYLPILFLLIFLSFFAHLGDAPLFDADEGAYSEVTREMMVHQDFTVALLNGMPFFHKPPLFYWAQAASMKILGQNELALRLPSAIAALLWVVSVFLFARRFYDTATAWYGALFMSGSLLITFIGRAATPEVLLNLFLTLTLLNIYRFYHSGNRRHIYWSFMFAALGVLTKGLIALLLPVAVSFTFFGIRKRWKDLMVLFSNPVGLIVFGLIVIPWYLGEFILRGKALFDDLFLLQGLENLSYNFIGESLPYYAYPIFILIGLLPFTAIFIRAFFHIRKLLTDDLMKFLLLWFVLALLFLPLSPPKSVFSIAYGFPPLFIIMARTADIFYHSIILFIGPLLFMALLLLMPHLAPYIAGSIHHEFAITVLTDGVIHLDSFYQMSLAAAISLLTILAFTRSVPVPIKFGIMGLLFVSIINFLVLPIIGDIFQQPIKSAALLAKRDKLKVITWGIHRPSFNVYAEMLTEERPPVPGDIVLSKTALLEKDMAYERLFEKQGIILAKILAFHASENNSSQGKE